MNRNVNLPNINNAILITSTQHIQTAVHLIDCPNEVLFIIGNHLSAKDITSLVKSGRDLGTKLESQDPGGKYEILVWSACRNRPTMIEILLKNLPPGDTRQETTTQPSNIRQWEVTNR